MKKLYSKMFMVFVFCFFMFFLSTSVFANERMQRFQFSVYAGPVVTLSASDVGGMHSAMGDTAPLLGKTINSDLMYASVQGMEIKQDILWGINGRYYFVSNFMDIGIDADLSVSSFKTPVQDVWVDGMGLSEDQPKSNSDIISLAMGPIFRYQGSGVLSKFNPYISPSISFHYGIANKVNLYPYTGTGLTRETLYPEYGQSGTSTIKGIGYGIKLGGEYFINDHFGFLIEYRYTHNDITIDHFRSFKYGLDMKTHTSAIIIGTMWSF